MHPRLCLVVAAALVIAASAPIAAQPPEIGRTLLPGTKAGVFSKIHGTAVNWTNGAMVNAVIRLRDARLGRVVDTVTTDKEGVFEFRPIDPGSYVVELMASGDGPVLAATPIINVTSGEAVSTLLKLPFRIPPLGGILGHSLPSALAITSAAAASGVLAKSIVGAPATDRALPGQ